MNNSRLIQLIQRLSRKELQGLRKFLHSPYFNQREDVIQLFEYLLKLLSQKKLRLEKEIIFNKIYPEQEYQDANFHLLKTYLFRLIEQYLTIKALREDSFASGLLLMRYYHNRNLPKHFDKTGNALKKRLEQGRLRDSRYYEMYRDIVWEEYQLAVKKQPSGELPLSELFTWTDLAFFSQKLRQICLLAAQQSLYRKASKMKDHTRKFFFQYIEQQGLLKITAIAIYYHSYFIIVEENEVVHFQMFKQLLFDNFSDFDQQEARELYLLAINFCIRKVNAGEASYFNELFSLYQDGLSKKILLEHGKLSVFSYHNIVAVALQMKSYDWALSFVENYKTYLDETEQRSAYHFNRARLAYEQGDYDQALFLIHNTTFKEVLPNLAVKTIILKIYYALQELDLLEAHLDAMINYIRRSRVLGYHKENYYNLARYTKRLVNLNPYDNKAIKSFYEEIQQDNILTEKQWLLSQLK